MSHSSNSDDQHNGKQEESTLEVALEKLNISPKTKRLLVLSLYGFLIYRKKSDLRTDQRDRTPDGVYGNNRWVYKKPFVDEFLEFCMERFEVAIWSNAQVQNVDGVLHSAFEGLRNRLLFVWDQRQCSDYGFKTLECKYKPLFFKELAELWRYLGRSSQGGRFSEPNTLLIDDDPYTALLNPPNTAIFPVTQDANDLLDPKGDLALYLEGLADAEETYPLMSKSTPLGSLLYLLITLIGVITRRFFVVSRAGEEWLNL